MIIDLKKFIDKGETVGVAVSGGSDSMALLYYLKEQTKYYPFSLVAINIEHGIRGKESKNDSLFVENYCAKNGITLFSFTVDAVKKAKDDKLTLEQSARILRYECFYSCLAEKKCDKIATAHHKKDNAESVLFNIFRGTGLKGIAGINDNFENKIIRPFLSVSKEEIDEYAKENAIPFVTDQTNFCDDYKRNYIRLNLLPVIQNAFPDYQDKIYNLSVIAKQEDEFLDQLASESVQKEQDVVFIKLPINKVLFNRACIIALKNLGVKKDWTKSHIDSCFLLTENENGAKLNLLDGITVVKEYDKIVFFKETENAPLSIPFSEGTLKFNGYLLCIEKASYPLDLKNGLFVDGDKIPEGAVIRYKTDGDLFTKFGGGTKKLNDYLTDKKVPLRIRDTLPLIAKDNIVYGIFGLAISDKVKIDENTKTIYKIYKK